MCLDDQILSTYMDGELKEPWKSQVEEHLTYCTSCSSRLKSLQELRSKLKDAELSDEEIKRHQERVLSMIEKTHLSKPKKGFTFKKQFKMTVMQGIGAAAAFVIVFVGSWSVFGNKDSKNFIKAPETTATIDISSITPVKTTEVVQKGLESYSIEEIMRFLDGKGYDVTVTLKGIKPLDEEIFVEPSVQIEEKVEEVVPEVIPAIEVEPVMEVVESIEAIEVIPSIESSNEEIPSIEAAETAAEETIVEEAVVEETQETGTLTESVTEEVKEVLEETVVEEVVEVIEPKAEETATN